MYDKLTTARGGVSMDQPGGCAEVRRTTHVETVFQKLETISARLHDANMRLDQHADKLMGPTPPLASAGRDSKPEPSSQLHRVAAMLDTLNGQLDFLARNVERFEGL